jgi:hypothetical protein
MPDATITMQLKLLNQLVVGPPQTIAESFDLHWKCKGLGASCAAI